MHFTSILFGLSIIGGAVWLLQAPTAAFWHKGPFTALAYSGVVRLTSGGLQRGGDTTKVRQEASQRCFAVGSRAGRSMQHAQHVTVK